MSRVLAGEDHAGDVDAMSAEEAARERLVVGLRRRAGVGRDAFRTASGYEIDAVAGAAVDRWVRAGLATDDGTTIRLTRAGLPVSDTLWGDVL